MEQLAHLKDIMQDLCYFPKVKISFVLRKYI